MLVALVLITLFLLFLFFSVPISMGMGIATLASMIVGRYDLSTLPMLIQKGANSYTLIAIPYFVLAANIMNRGGITNRIFDFAESLCGWMHGGLAQVNVLSSVIFAGISGTAMADAAGLGTVEIEAMDKRGYDRGWAVAITLASAMLGPIIPPSVSFIIYGCLADVSISKLFVAGILPGAIITVCLMVANHFIAVSGKVACPPPMKFSMREIIRTFKRGFFALMAPVLLLVCLIGGFVTATETGLIAVIYSLIVSIIYKEMNIKDLFNILIATIQSTAVIMFLIGMGTGIAYVMTLERMPQLLTTALFGLTTNKHLMLLIILIILTILGMFIDATTISIVTIPLLLPIIDALAISRLHFGVVFSFVGLVGMATPPVGTGLMVMCSISKMKFEDVVKSFMPFFIPLVAALLILTYCPIITTLLPDLLFSD